MMKEKLLSVIVPIYNVEQYLSECVDSILEQTYKNIEVILVDDGSTDESGALCDLYKKRDKRVKVIHKENEGLLVARLTGVYNASGEYIAFVDGDDWIQACMYKNLMEIQQNTNSDVVMSGIYRFISKDKIIEEMIRLDEGLYNRQQLQERIWPVMLWGPKCNSSEIDPSLCTKIFKKNIILEQLKKASKVGVYYAEDTITLYPLLLEANDVFITKKCYYYHRQRRSDQVASYIKDTEFIDKTYKVYKYLQSVFGNNQVGFLFEKQIDYFFMNSVQLKKKCYSNVKEEREDVFPFLEFKKDTKIIIYGAGITGKKYVEQNNEYNFCDIVGWVDKNYKVLQSENYNVISPKELENISYDKILVAIRSQWLASEIIDELQEQGISQDKIVWAGTSMLHIER